MGFKYNIQNLQLHVLSKSLNKRVGEKSKSVSRSRDFAEKRHRLCKSDLIFLKSLGLRVKGAATK